MQCINYYIVQLVYNCSTLNFFQSVFMENILAKHKTFLTDKHFVFGSGVSSVTLNCICINVSSKILIMWTNVVMNKLALYDNGSQVATTIGSTIGILQEKRQLVNQNVIPSKFCTSTCIYLLKRALDFLHLVWLTLSRVEYNFCGYHYVLLSLILMLQLICKIEGDGKAAI